MFFFLYLFSNLKVHLVVEKCVNERMQCFGPLLKRVRKFVVNYRISSKAKAFFVTVFEKRLPGFIKSRWYISSFLLIMEVFNVSVIQIYKEPLFIISDLFSWQYS